MEYLSFICITLVAFAVPLFALRMGKSWLVALLPIYLITGNVFAESFISIAGAMTSLAVPVYAATFLITDSLSEHYGKQDARRAVFLGFMGQLLFLGMTLAVIYSPIFPDKATAYSSVFAILPRLILGSFVAYMVSQIWDIQLFHALKEKFGGGKKTLWVRNNLSTMTSQTIDTTIFLAIAFSGRVENFWGFWLSVLIFKLVVALLDTPYLYLTYSIISKKEK